MKKVGLSLLVAVLLLLVLECALRVAGYADNPSLYFDPEIGLRYYPNQRRHMLAGQRDVGEMTINSAGFRSPPFESKKPAGTCRVVCLGDSFTLGWGVDDMHTYPRFLQARFDAGGGGGRKVEVLNCGLSDFNTVNEERLYRKIVRAFEPDVVVLAYVLNDMQPETLGPINMNSRLEHLVGSTAIMRFLREKLWHRLGVYQFGENSENRRLRAEFSRVHSEILREPDGEIGRPFWSVSMAALDVLAGEVREDGARLLLVSFPDRWQIEGAIEGRVPEAARAPQRRLEREVAALGIPFLDLTDAFAKVGVDAYSEIDHFHPSVPGMQVAADAIGKVLDELGPCR